MHTFQLSNYSYTLILYFERQKTLPVKVPLSLFAALYITVTSEPHCPCTEILVRSELGSQTGSPVPVNLKAL